MSALDVMNLSQAKAQVFSIPKPLINYIFDNSQHIILSQKLIKTCKTFKLLHLKKAESHLDKLVLVDGRCKILAGLSKILSQRQPAYYITTLFPKLDLSQAKEVKVSIEASLNRNVLEKCLPSSLEIFELMCFSCKDANPALLAFQRCPKIKEIDIGFILNSTIPIITKTILKEMLLTKRENQIKKFHFDAVSELDQDDLINLIDNHLAKNCYIVLSTTTREAYNEMKQIFAKDIRQNMSEGFKFQICFNGLSYSNTWI